MLSLLLSTELQDEGQGDKKAVEVLPPIFLFRGQQKELSRLLDGMGGGICRLMNGFLGSCILILRILVFLKVGINIVLIGLRFLLL